MHHLIVRTGAAGRVDGAEILITTVLPTSPDDHRAKDDWGCAVIGDTLVLEAAKAVVLTAERTP